MKSIDMLPKANKNAAMLLLFDENSLTEPERRSEQACRPERRGSMRHQQALVDAQKEIDNIYESSALRFSNSSGIRCDTERARSNTAV
jgi:hypothetical protein